MNASGHRLAEAVQLADRAAARLRASYAHDGALLAQAVSRDDQDPGVLRAVDAFVQRFQQMCEHMARRLLPAIYRIEQLGERPPPLLQLLTWAEELELIASVRGWMSMAEARNRLVHEYPLDSIERRAALAAAVQYADVLLDEFAITKGFIADRRLLENSSD